MLPVTYTFEPGEPGDGVTVHVPLAVLNRVAAHGFDWQVPGFREELVGALVRSLPKQYRRLLIPIAERAREAFEQVDPAGGPLVDELARVVSALAGERIPSSAFDIARVPDHLRISFAVEDADGRRVALGKDLEALRARFSSRTRVAIAETAQDLERAGLRTWDFATLPRLVEADRDGHAVRGYPALLDDGDSVSIRVLTNPAIQERVMRTGVRRLLLLAVPVGRKAVERDVTNEVRLAIGRGAGITLAGLADDCTIAAADRVIDEHGSVPWNEEDFLALRERARADLADIAADAMATAGRIIVATARVEARLDRLVAPALQPAVSDARAQLARLVRPGFVAASGVRRLDDVLRYVSAVDRRMERVAADTGRDRQRMDEVNALERRYEQLLRKLPRSAVTSEVVEVGWLIEELRVSLFAQVLGTSGPVSVPRITRELARLEADVTR